MNKHKTLIAISFVASLYSATTFAARNFSDEYLGINGVNTSDMQPGVTVLDQRFEYPRGRPIITTRMLEIEPGNSTEWHYHAIPVVVTVISGQIVIDYGSMGTRTFVAGDSYIEAINTCHAVSVRGSELARIHSVFLSKQRADQTEPSECDGPQ